MKIPYGRQVIEDDDIQAVISVLKSDFLTQGPKVPDFEALISTYVNAKFAIAMNSATSALHLACITLDLKEGDIVWTSPNSFVASANCALYCKAIVDFIDISLSDFNIDINVLEKKLQKAKKDGKLPKILIPVHFGGKSCDMKRISELQKEYGFKVIEDASHAIGGSYENNRVGSCEYSDITIFSFHPVKIVTTGEGGMALTNSAELAKKLSLLKTHGITREREDFCGSLKEEPVCYYEQQHLGYNFRMTDISAALGVSQGKKIDRFIQQRRQIAKAYDEAFTSAGIVFQKQTENVVSAYHLYVIQVEHKNQMIKYLHQNGILVNCHYIPIYLQPYYANTFGFKAGYCPNSETYYKKAISLPMYATLKDFEIEYIIEKILQYGK